MRAYILPQSSVQKKNKKKEVSVPAISATILYTAPPRDPLMQLSETGVLETAALAASISLRIGPEIALN